MKRVPTVTIAISAYNEELNIRNFLNSVLQQREYNFKLDKIWIHSDGSTDNTVKIARSFKSKKVKVFDHKKRIGKSARLNQIYNELKSDILVQSDADVIFQHPLVVSEIVGPIIKSKKVKMCGGNPCPMDAVTFIEKCINSSVAVYLNLRGFVHGGHNKFSADGRLLAFEKSFIKQIRIPEDMIANDMFVFMSCKSLRFDYRFVKSAIVLFRSPQSLRDHIKQNVRFESAEQRMNRFFSHKLVEKETSIPKFLLAKLLLKQFIKTPVYSTVILFINQYCRYLAMKKESTLTAKWAMANSTKGVIQ